MLNRRLKRKLLRGVTAYWNTPPWVTELRREPWGPEFIRLLRARRTNLSGIMNPYSVFRAYRNTMRQALDVSGFEKSTGGPVHVKIRYFAGPTTRRYWMRLRWRNDSQPGGRSERHFRLGTWKRRFA